MFQKLEAFFGFPHLDLQRACRVLGIIGMVIGITCHMLILDPGFTVNIIILIGTGHAFLLYYGATYENVEAIQAFLFLYLTLTFAVAFMIVIYAYLAIEDYITDSWWYWNNATTSALLALVITPINVCLLRFVRSYYREIKIDSTKENEDVEKKEVKQEDVKKEAILPEFVKK